MAEGGLERGEINGSLTSMDSVESRWVFQDEDDSAVGDDEEEDDVRHRASLDSEDDEEDDNAEQRLIRTGPRIDSFDVEALEVPGAHRHEYEVCFLFYFISFLIRESRKCIMAFSVSDWIMLAFVCSALISVVEFVK